MSRNSGHKLSVMLFTMAAGLMLPACRICTETTHDGATVSEAARETRCKLNEIIIPELAFPPHATITDAVDFLKQASRTYDTPWRFSGHRGVHFNLHLPPASQPLADPFTGSMPTNPVYAMRTAMSIRSISLHDALELVCDLSRMSWHISEDGTVVIKEIVWPDRKEWETRSYTVPQELADALFNKRDGQASDVELNKVWELFFEQLGVKRPVYRTVGVPCTCGKTHRDLTEYVYQPITGMLRVTNTPWNLEIIDQVFEVFAVRKVEVELQIHAFHTADIERLRLSDGVSLDTLMALRQTGKAKPVASATALTKSGQEVIVKAVQEVIYPEELLAEVGQTGSNMTVRSATQALVPANFRMREIGMILQVIPEVSAIDRSQIHLTIKPQWITLDHWESYRADLAAGWIHTTHSFKQPVFGVTRFNTQVAVKDAETVLLGSCSTPGGEWVHAGFLTARCMDSQADMPAKKALQQELRRDAEVLKKLKHIVIPEVLFRPPDTILDALRFFKEASMKYDKPIIPKAQRGVSFGLRFGQGWVSMGNKTNRDPFAASSATCGMPVLPSFSARFISLYDALKLVCDITGMKLSIRNGVVWIVPDNGYDEKYMTRIYPIPSSYSFASCERIRVDAGSFPDENQTQDWKPFFEKLGVRLALASSFSVTKLSSVNLLSVTSSRQTLDEIEQALEKMVYSRKVEVDVQIHAFHAEDIEQVRLSGEISMEALMALRKAGRGKPVASAMVVTKSGQEAVVKAVKEVLYPMELLTVCGQAVSTALFPGNFTMREAGMILQVVPEISSSDQSQINVILKPTWVTLEGWKSYPAERASGCLHNTLSLRQPVFGTTCFEAQTLVVAAGKTVLLGSSSTPDGKWVHVGFLTVKECR